MIVFEREQKYELKQHEKTIILIDTKVKAFLEPDIIPVLNFIESKGLTIFIPSIIDGNDATFVYKKLQNSNLGPTAEALCFFLYTRIENNPVKINHRNLFTRFTNGNSV